MLCLQKNLNFCFSKIIIIFSGHANSRKMENVNTACGFALHVYTETLENTLSTDQKATRLLTTVTRTPYQRRLPLSH